jgi:beta-galactosidase
MMTTSRKTLNFNREWKFQLGDHKGAEAGSFDDAQWDNVGLPHSFSLPYFASTQFYTGYGWYRKHFQVPASWKGQRLSLDFEGVFQHAEVFVNGQAVGRHRGGYTGFEVDITGAAKTGDNLVAVRVNNLWDATLAPRAGEHVFSGGIYRDVNLVAKKPLHVAWCGTSITTPQVSKEAATVKVQTEVVNGNSSVKGVTVRQTIFAPDGKQVAQWQSKQSVAAGQTATFDQTSKPLANPQLWHPDHPLLYSVKTAVLDGSRVVDETTSPLGFRWFKWTADQGFFLNGEHLYIYGANVHQDHAGWGDAVTNAGFERDVRMVKDAGFNMIRGSHYPHDPAFAEACDRLGVLLWSENAFWGIGGFKPGGYWNSSAYPPDAKDQPEFEASVKQQLGEMIRIYRNHPSIVVWSMSNEPFFSEKSVIPRMKAFLGELVATSHKLDPTRPAAIGGAQRPLDENRIDLVGDIAGYNGDGASLPNFQNPGIPNFVSEYGSVTSRRPGNYAPGWDQLAKDGGKPVHPWRSGQAIWCLFDHGSIAGDNLGRMGIVDYFRIPKRAWYWYRNEYQKIPPPVWPVEGTPAKLRLQADKSTLKAVDGTDDTHLLVTVLDAEGKELSNNVPVTLELVSGPGEFPTGPSITFEPKSDIAILDGKAAIEFRSYYAGTSVIRASSPGLTPAEITITSQGGPKWVKGVTPTVKPRPYTRFTQAPTTAAVPGAQELRLAADRPTRASSSAATSSSANVNDGKTSTFWQAAGDDITPWIRVDLENTYSLNRVQLVFPEAGLYRYKIEVSANGTDWTTVVDQSQSENTDQMRTATGNFGSGIRFLRVSFSGAPQGKAAALTEVAVGGGTDLKFNAGQLGGTIIGTSGSWDNNPNTTKDAALDANPSTFFDSLSGNGSWVGLDLGTGKSARLTKIRFRPRADTDANSKFSNRMLGGKFQGANTPDFRDAVDLFSIAEAPAQGQMTEAAIINPTPFRYVRYLSPNGSNGNVGEVEFYG